MSVSERPTRPPTFNPHCSRCGRLVEHLEAVRAQYSGYHCGPVSGFGAGRYRLLIVGLAPGLHGANRTGRTFSGDASGELLFKCLHRAGLANMAVADGPGDGLRLSRTRLTNAVKCLPPGNRPSAAEVNACQSYLTAELAGLTRHGAILALGRMAHDAVLRALGVRRAQHPFAHAAEHQLDGLTLVDSYHCSRYNVSTRRLDEPMLLDAITRAARAGGAAS